MTRKFDAVAQLTTGRRYHSFTIELTEQQSAQLDQWIAAHPDADDLDDLSRDNAELYRIIEQPFANHFRREASLQTHHARRRIGIGFQSPISYCHVYRIRISLRED